MAIAVHPHARGEVAWDALTAVLTGRFTPTHVGKSQRCQGIRKRVHGSPPRTWGSPAYNTDQPGARRFTPTHVGKSLGASVMSGVSSVHPHARGEVVFFLRIGGSLGGSPPRTWGSREHLAVHAPRRRFTPTHVGKSGVGVFFRVPLSVHPHARGEVERPVARYAGEPVHPHARGEVTCRALTTYFQYGSPPRTWGSRSQDHSVQLQPLGSPPRTWGSRHQPGAQRVRVRFTPTHVGKSHSPVSRRPPGPVHPHARGEVGKKLCARPGRLGSPPRTWGSPDLPSNLPIIIPVHPHARGEVTSRRLLLRTDCGSPPRTWGSR